MRRLLLFLFAIAATTSLLAQSHDMPANMEAHMLVLLVKPPNAPDFPKEKLEELQAAHLANIRRLAEEKKLLKAGPFEDYSGRNVRGMFIFESADKREVEQLVASDPLVKAGRLAPEYLKWWTEQGSLK
ncbi:MAG: YciI family protein [Chthoniobacterales bacterium]